MAASDNLIGLPGKLNDACSAELLHFVSHLIHTLVSIQNEQSFGGDEAQNPIAEFQQVRGIARSDSKLRRERLQNHVVDIHRWPGISKVCVRQIA